MLDFVLLMVNKSISTYFVKAGLLKKIKIDNKKHIQNANTFPASLACLPSLNKSYVP